MTASLALFIAGSAAALAIWWTPSLPSGSLYGVRPHRTGSGKDTALFWTIPAVGGAAGGVLLGWTFIPVFGAVAWVMAASIRAQRRMKADARRAEAMARLTAVLANQTLVATNVSDALRRSAPLVSGPVGDAAAAYAAGCADNLHLQAGADFRRAVPGSAAARWLTEAVDATIGGGGQIGPVLETLDNRASEAAVKARYAYGKVGAMMTSVATVTAVSALVVAVMAPVAGLADWMTSQPVGQMTLIASAGAVALLAGWAIAPAGKLTR